jgi:hypothetical protein
MSFARLRTCLAILLCLVVVAGVSAGEKAAQPGAGQDEQVVTTHSQPRTPASSVAFAKSLNLPFESVRTLGARIDAARRASDPVALANAANELAVDEKVSGKTASLTSKQLIEEAAEIASLRRQNAELRAVLHVANQVGMEQTKMAALKDQYNLAEIDAKAYQQALATMNQPPPATHQVVINNHTQLYLDLFVNGWYAGQILPGSSQTFTVQPRQNPPTVLRVSSNEDDISWAPRYIWGKFVKYTWNVY